jgi:hypothetical protein
VPGSPFELERQMPLPKNDAYTIVGSLGSNITRRAPRTEHGVDPRNTCGGVASVQLVVLPWFTSVNV